MSHSASYEYEIAAQRRREVHLQRIRETTQGFVVRYHALLSDLAAQDLLRFVAAEAEEVRRAIVAVEATLAADPERAREVSRTIASQIHALPTMAREARRAVEALERENARLREEEAARSREASHAIWDTLVGGWADPLERAVAYPELVRLRRRFFPDGKALSGSDEVRTALDLVRTAAIQEAAARRMAAAQAADSDVARAASDHALLALREDAKGCAAAEQVAIQAAAACERLVGAERDVAVAAAATAVDAAVVDERCRREAVAAVRKALEASGFVVEKAYLEKTEGPDEVVIRAAKPAGNRAEFRVTATGDLSWHFDRYVGRTCKRDIDRVRPMLQEIYGIKLSNERTHWENPDDRSASSRPQPAAHQEKNHGDK